MKKDEKRKETNRKIVHQFLFNGINGDFDARDGYYEPNKLEILMPNVTRWLEIVLPRSERILSQIIFDIAFENI